MENLIIDISMGYDEKKGCFYYIDKDWNIPDIPENRDYMPVDIVEHDIKIAQNQLKNFVDFINKVKQS